MLKLFKHFYLYLVYISIAAAADYRETSVSTPINYQKRFTIESQGHGSLLKGIYSIKQPISTL